MEECVGREGGEREREIEREREREGMHAGERVYAFSTPLTPRPSLNRKVERCPLLRWL